MTNIYEHFPTFDNLELFNKVKDLLSDLNFIDTTSDIDEMPNLGWICPHAKEPRIFIYVNFNKEPIADYDGVYNEIELLSEFTRKGYSPNCLDDLLSEVKTQIEECEISIFNSFYLRPKTKRK